MPADPRNNRRPPDDLFPLPGVSDIGRVIRSDADDSIGDLPTAFETDGPAETAAKGFIGLTVSDRTLRIFFGLLAAGLAVVVLRLAQVQIINGAYYAKQAEGNRSRTELIPSQRGIIYDRSGQPLVRNVPNFTVLLRPAELPAGDAGRQAVARLAAAIGSDPETIRQAIDAQKDRPLDPVIVGERLTHDQAVLASVEAAQDNAVELDVGTRRDYTDAADIESLSHIIGYEGRLADSDVRDHADYLPSDLIGKTGVEKFYESTLRGAYGRRTVEIDALGRKKDVISEEPGQPGLNLVLSIDLDLQKQAEAALKAELKAIGKTRGSVIVLQPQTGEILAMVSEPGFDGNLFARGISAADYQKLADNPDHPLFPRAIAGSLPSGSVFKLAVSSAALEEGTITPSTTVLSTGGIHVDKWFFPDWKAGGHGLTNVTKALAESVNTFFYAIGGGYGSITGLGVDRIIAYARKFGLGSQLGVDLAGEGSGFLPSKQWKKETKGESWYIGDTYHLAIGQGDLLVTPLQIASMTAVFANGGQLIQPHVVAALTSSDGSRQVVEPKILNPQVVSSRTIDVVRQGLRQTVTEGSARSLQDLPVAVAAKTGTAQWNANRPNHAWFTSFAPYNNAKLVVTVVIEEGGEGSSTAAPVAKDIYAWYFGPH